MARHRESDYSRQALKNAENIMTDATRSVRTYVDDHKLTTSKAVESVIFDFRLNEQQSSDLKRRFGI